MSRHGDDEFWAEVQRDLPAILTRMYYQNIRYGDRRYRDAFGFRRRRRIPWTVRNVAYFTSQWARNRNRRALPQSAVENIAGYLT